MTDDQWIIEKIKRSDTIEKLNYWAEIVKFDLDDGYQFADVKLIRLEWAKRKKEIEMTIAVAAKCTIEERK